MVDLGNEPPLGLDHHVEEPVDPRRISIRWLAATVLTALSGASLMGGAVYAALDGEYRFAVVPEMARIALKAASDRASNLTRKTEDDESANLARRAATLEADPPPTDCRRSGRGWSGRRS